MRKTNEMFKSLVAVPVKITNDNATAIAIERDTNGASFHKNSYALSDNNFKQFHLSNNQMTASSSLPQPSMVFYEKSSPITIHNNQNNLKSSQYISSIAPSSSSNSYDGGSLQMNALHQYQDNNTKYQTPFSQNNIIIAHNSERPKPTFTKDSILNYTNNLESNIPKDTTKIDPTYLQNPDSGKIGFQNLIIPRFMTNVNPLDTMIAFQSPRSPKFIKKENNLPEDNHTAFFNNPPTDSTIVGIEPNEKYQSPQNSLVFGSPTFKKVTSSKPIMKKILSRPPSFEEIPDDLSTVGAKSNTAIENDFETLSNRLNDVAINEEGSSALHRLEKKIGMVESLEGCPVINIRKPIFDRNYKPGLESNLQKQKLESAQKINDEISNSNKKQRKNYKNT